MINGKRIKVCGMREEDNIREVEKLGVDMIGFIFYPKSPRYVKEVPAYLPEKAMRTGVFVNEDIDVIETHMDKFSLDFIQLHGNESPEFCRKLTNKGVRIIKAFSIANDEDLQSVNQYEGICRYFLFDTKCEQYGGSGNKFDWNVLHDYKGNTPFFLSGGISVESTEAIKNFSHPKFSGIDINSCFEVCPGKKDIKMIEEFLNQLL